MRTIICNPDDKAMDVQRLTFILGTFYKTLPVTLYPGSLVVTGQIRHKILIPHEHARGYTPRRMWINQPSTLQPLHAFNGMNVIAVHEYDDTARIYWLSGDIESSLCSWSCLSEGWRS